MVQTTLFTSANKLYEMFVLPYVSSGLIYNDDARVEICLEDPAEFEFGNGEAIELLRANVGADRLLLRGVEASADVAPNSVRFLETPRVTTEFTYIGDIDILILEPISPLHLRRMSELGLPYSNVLREGREALSGLHFTRTDAYYPVEVPPNIDLNRDEELLYHLVTARGLPLPPSSLGRPMHGYHLSPNRSPLARMVDGCPTLHWSLTSQSYFKSYTALRRNPVWRELFPFFDRRYRAILGLLELGLANLDRGFEPNWDDEVLALLHDAPLVHGILTSGRETTRAQPQVRLERQLRELRTNQEQLVRERTQLAEANSTLRREKQELRRQRDVLQEYRTDMTSVTSATRTRITAVLRHADAEIARYQVQTVELDAFIEHLYEGIRAWVNSRRWRLGDALLSLPRRFAPRGPPWPVLTRLEVCVRAHEANMWAAQQAAKSDVPLLAELPPSTTLGTEIDSIAVREESMRTAALNRMLFQRSSALRKSVLNVTERQRYVTELIQIAEAMATSRRWRLGHFLLSLPRRALGRSYPTTVADALSASICEYRRTSQ